MPIVADYTPPGGKPPAARRPPCCSACAGPADRARARRLVADVVARRAGGELGAEEDEPWFWTPSTIEGYVSKANEEIWALARDYSAAIRAGQITHAQLAAFKGFFSAWEKWRAGLNWMSWLTYGTVSTAKSYRATAGEWRKQLVATGYSPSAPAPLGPPPSTLPDTLKWVGIGAAAIGGAVALGHVVRGIGLFKRAPA